MFSSLEKHQGGTFQHLCQEMEPAAGEATSAEVKRLEVGLLVTNREGNGGHQAWQRALGLNGLYSY